METAVTDRNYAEAEQFRVRLTELAEEKALASEKEQHTNSSSSPVDSVAKVTCAVAAVFFFFFFNFVEPKWDVT